VFVWLIASPLRVGAQDGEKGDSAVERGHPEALVGPTLREMNLRVRRARIGLVVSAVPIFVGTGMALGYSIVGLSDLDTNATQDRAASAGIALLAAGGASMIATGILLAVRTHQRRRFREAALHVASDWGYIEAQRATCLDGRLDEVCAIIWCLGRRL